MSRPPTATPLTVGEFADLMAACGPFEDKPHIAVTVSGGSDSLALTFLAADWAAAQGGRTTALTVDHKLRPESTAEARQVAEWLGPAGIDHAILEWTGEKPRHNLMAAARDARYALLSEWCRRHGVLHLLLAHHMEDQAATFLLRLKRGSGLDGLAAMAHVREGFPRLLRPLLDVPKARLSAFLENRHHTWIEDPTNQNPDYERNRIDAFLAESNPLRLTTHRIASAVAGLARAKKTLERDVAAILVESVTVSPLGMAEMDLAAFRKQPQEIQLRLLSRILLTIGGNTYPPRSARLSRLRQALLSEAPAQGRTLGGCRIRVKAGCVSVFRETAAIPPPYPVTADRFLWDHRFRIDLPTSLLNQQVRIGRLTVDHWRQLKAHAPAAKDVEVPAAVRWTLPVLWDETGLLAAPTFGFAVRGAEGTRIAFTPRHALT